jgi:stress response protein YsnF
MASHAPPSSQRHVIPLAAEHVVVDKVVEPVERVRAETRVTERELDVETEVVKETIEVSRVPISRFVDEAPVVRVEGDTTIVPVVEEVAFVQKRLLLKEEVHLTKRRAVEQRTARVPVREEHVHVERLPLETAARRKS